MMEPNTIDQRVGYTSISILRNVLKDYISAHVIEGKYRGEIRYLILYQKYDKIIKDNLFG